MPKTRFTIPIFIPELSCNNKCVFCNQRAITGVHKIMQPEETEQFIEKRLLKILNYSQQIEIAFFGGNFTGIPLQQQEELLKVAHKFIISGKVSSVRISTRPDYITKDKLQLLKRFGVKTIEIGAQSMCDEVLAKSGRNHTSKDTQHASRLILAEGFRLGLQMMIGLPGDTPEKAVMTAKQIIELGASETRIYPLIVMKNTPLAELYEKGLYNPLTIEQAIDIAAMLIEIFTSANVSILRIGLHPSEEICNGSMIAGPWHPSFGQLAYTRYWHNIIKNLKQNHPGMKMTLYVPPKQFQNAIGYKRANLNTFSDITIYPSALLKGNKYEFDYC